MKMIDPVIDAVTKHYRLTLFVTLIITIFMASFFIKQDQDNNIGVFFEDNDPIYKRYSDFIEEYGSEEFVLLAFKGENIFTPFIIGLTRELTEKLRNIEGIERVVGLTDVEVLTGKDEEIIFDKIIPEGELSEEELETAREKTISNRMIRGSLISEDGKTAAIYIELEPLKQKKKFSVLNEVVAVSKEVAGDKINFYYTGIPFLEDEINRLSQKDVRTFSPVTSLLVFIIIIMLFRNFTLAILAMLTLFITQIWGVGLLVLWGEKLNWVSSPMTAILLAMAIADSVHLLTHFKEIYVPGSSAITDKISEATKTIFMPCLLTTITTSIGFFSFTTSPLRPSCIMGIFTAIGIILAFVIDVTFLPASLVLMRERITKTLSVGGNALKIKNNGIFHRILLRLGHFSTTYIKTLLIVFIVVIALSITGMTRLKFETNSSNHLHDSNKIKADSKFLDDNLGGSIPFMVLVESTGDMDFSDPYAVNIVDQVQHTISDHDKEFITKATSIVDYAKEFNKAFNNNEDVYYKIPSSKSDIMDFYELGSPELLERMISSDKKEVCISFLSKWGTNERALESHDYYESSVGTLLGDAFTFAFTGLTTLYIAMEEMLRISQQRSLMVAFGLIFLMMLVVCRNVKLAILSMIPNTLPILMTLGIMGWLEIPLDVSTIMIASVTLGIAVDDTIHFIAWYRRLAGPGIPPEDAIIKTFGAVGKPIMITTLLLFIGFGVFILGNFRPTQVFGVLTAFSMLFALIGDFFLLPALILIFKPEIKPDVYASEGIHPAEKQKVVGPVELSHAE